MHSRRHTRVFSRFPKSIGFLIAAGALTIPVASSRAVIINYGDGSGNTTQGSMPAAWDNVGTVDSASGVYLGNGWVITAYHVGGVGENTPIDFGDSVGAFKSDGNVVRLKTDGVDADLQMFHLKTLPNLPALNIPASTPALRTSIYMVGYGRNRGAALTGYNKAGYLYGIGNTKRWGTNITSKNGADTIQTPNVEGNGPTQVFFADFSNDLTATTYEAQVADGDSGGGVFDSGGNLIGLMNYKSTFKDQPGSTAVFGNLSDMADLSFYRSQIYSVIPEPTCLAVLLAGGLMLLGSRRRSKK